MFDNRFLINGRFFTKFSGFVWIEGIHKMKFLKRGLFCSFAILDPRVGPPWTYFLHLSMSSVILTDSSMERVLSTS